VVAVLLLAGCGGGGKEPPAPPARVIVSRAVAHTTALKSFHFVLKVENAAAGAPGLTITNAEGDLLVPDRLRGRINGTFSRTPVQTEIVIVGNRSFLRDPLTKKWRPYPAGANPAVLVKGVPTVLRRATGLRNSGSERVGDADTYRLAGQVAAAVVAPLVGVQASGRLVPFTIWVGKKDYVLRRARLEGPVARSEPSDIVRAVELSKFDEPVTIRPPAASG
jgi:hypothetical protein